MVSIHTKLILRISIRYYLIITMFQQIETSEAEIKLEKNNLKVFQAIEMPEDDQIEEKEFEAFQSQIGHTGFGTKKRLLILLACAIVLSIYIYNRQTEFEKRCRPYLWYYRELQTPINNHSMDTDYVWSGKVVDVPYAEKEYQSLPINLRRRNREGKTIEEVLYKDEEIKTQRIEYIKERIDFVDKHTFDLNQTNGHSNIVFAKYNLISSDEHLKQAIEENRKDWLRLEKKFGLSAIAKELPMCVIVPGYNNNKNFRIQANLNSVFTQNYSNYKVVLIDDNSNDGTQEAYLVYLAFHAIDKQSYTYIKTDKRLTALPNLYFASMNHCRRDSVVLYLDADDELISSNVLQVFNWAYQTKKASVVYSNFYWFQQPLYIREGFTSEYSEQEKRNSLYRNILKFSQLRSYMNELIFEVNPRDIKDSRGFFYNYTYDHALFYPMMELSCGRVYNIDHEVHYLYRLGTELNIRNLQYQCKEQAIQMILVKKKKYPCSPRFARTTSTP